MKRTLGAYSLPLAVVVLTIGVPTSAHAYLDAGTGSMLLQLLLGGVAGLAIAGKLYWHSFLSAIGIRKPREDEGTVEERAPTVEMNARGRE